MEIGSATDAGPVRPRNEDCFATHVPSADEGSLLDAVALVADGIGGERGGEEASRMAVDQVLDELTKSFLSKRELEAPDLVDVLRRAIREVSDQIYRLGSRDPAVRGLGSTLVAAVFRDGELLVGHVGDSRCYRLRGGKIERLTEDHTWVAGQVEAGVLTPEQAQSHPQRNVLVRTLGDAVSPGVDVRREELEDGDLLILCTDGLSGALSEAEILQVSERFQDPQDLAEALVALANDSDGSDNATAVVCRCHDSERVTPDSDDTEPILRPEALRRPTPRRSPWVYVVLALVAAALLWIGTRIVAIRAFEQAVMHAEKRQYLQARQELTTAIRWGLDRRRIDILIDEILNFRPPAEPPPEPPTDSPEQDER